MSSAKILVVEEDQWIRNSLQLFFEEEGCSIVALETAEEGLDEIEKCDFDIIIADYQLPGMNGLNFLKRVQSFTQHSYAILITAYRDKKVKSEASRLGIRDFIDKPFSAKTLESSLSSLLGGK